MNQETINMIAGIAFSVFGWFARVLWVAVRDLEKDLAKLREDLPQTYLPKHEARDLISDLTKEIRDNFNRIFTLLDNKADK
jgi:cell division protein FtsB